MLKKVCKDRYCKDFEIIFIKEMVGFIDFMSPRYRPSKPTEFVLALLANSGDFI